MIQQYKKIFLNIYYTISRHKLLIDFQKVLVKNKTKTGVVSSNHRLE